MKKTYFSVAIAAIIFCLQSKGLQAQGIHFDSSIVRNRIPCGATPANIIALTHPSNSTGGYPINGYPTNAIKYCWPFALYYDDIANNTNKGFDDPSLGAKRQATFCAVLNYIASVINFNGHIPNTDYITVHVNQSFIIPQGFYAEAGPNWEFTVTGANWPSQGIYDGSVFDHYINGVTPDVNTWDCAVTVNFSGSVLINNSPSPFSFEDDYTVNPFPNCDIDLYSVLLHEMTHCLGFISDVDENLLSRVPVCGGGNNEYTLYDWDYLFHANSYPINGGFNKIISGTDIAPVINPAIANIDAIGDGQLWLTSDPKNATKPQPDPNQPVYSGLPLGFYQSVWKNWMDAPGSYASHLDNTWLDWTMRASFSPEYQPQYVMSPFSYYGKLDREYTLPEVRALLGLINPVNSKSYQINPTFTYASIIGNHPPVVLNAQTDNNNPNPSDVYPDLVMPPDYTMPNTGTSWTYNVTSDPNVYDPDGDPLQIYPGSVYNIRGCGSDGGNNESQLTITNTTISFKPRPDFIGRVQFGFYLYDGKEKGAFRVVTIDITPGSAFSNLTNCNTPTGPNYGPELVINGNYESGTHTKIIPSDEFAVNSSSIYGYLEGAYYLGVNFPDSHPLDYHDYEWTNSYGAVIGSSWKDCSVGTFTGEFGEKPFDFPNIFWNLPNDPCGGNRYHVLYNGNLNYFTLGTTSPIIFPVSQCKEYTLTFHIDFDNSGRPVNSTYNILVGFSSTVSASPSYNYFITIPVTIGTGWQTITKNFWYCGNTPSFYMNFDVSSNPNVAKPVLLDDVSLVNVLNPAPMTVSATANPPLFLCTQGSATLSATVTNGACGQTYVWQPGNLTGQVVVVNPVFTTTYTVTATDVCGMTATATVTVTVYPNCCVGNCPGPNTFTNVTVDATNISAYTGYFTNASCNLAINGTMTINDNLTITNCSNILMGGNAIIDVKPGNTLTISNSHLYACGNMWQGIIVEQGATLNIINSSIIEDAIQAIDMPGAAIPGVTNVTVANSTMNNDYNGIVINPPAQDINVFNLSLTGSTISSSSLKAPYAGKIMNTGVYLNNLGAQNMITIGDGSLASLKNTFNKMNYGINAFNSSFTVYNNLFENMTGDPCIACLPPCSIPPLTGIAIYATGNPTDAFPSQGLWQDNMNYFYQAIVGGNSAPYQLNTMTNVCRGVDISGYAYPVVSYNQLSNTTNIPVFPNLCSPYGDHGIFLKEIIEPEVTNNSIVDFSTGIHLINFLLTGGYPASPYVINNSSNVSNNTIDVNAAGVMQSGIIAEKGIDYCSAPSRILIANCPYLYPLNIEKNYITTARSAGIALRNVMWQFASPFVSPTYVNINDNNIILYPSTCSDRTQRAGILLSNNAWSIEVTNNNINGGGTSIDANGNCFADNNVRGIYVLLSTSFIGYDICSNFIVNVGQCLRFENMCSPQYVYDNDMHRSYEGWVLWNSGQIGTQGNATLPIGDAWHGPFLNYATWTQNSFALNSPIYVKSSPPFYSPTPNSSFPPNSGYTLSGTINSAIGSNAVCPNAVCIPCHSALQQQLRKIVHDSVVYPAFAFQSAYHAKQSVLTSLLQDTSLMSGDTALQNFYNTAPGTNMGKINTIWSFINIDSVSPATLMNNALAPANIIEANYKTVNNIYLNTLAIGKDSIDSLQAATLFTIAKECPLSGGRSVFIARTMLNRLLNTSIVFQDSCVVDSMEDHRARKIMSNSEFKSPRQQFELYPNPNSGNMILEYSIAANENARLVLYDMLGQEIYNHVLSPNQQKIGIQTNLPNGVFLYSIISTENGILKTGKVVIIK